MFHIIVNPASSSGHGKSQWEKLAPILKRSGVSYHVHYSSPFLPVEKICARLTGSGHPTKLIIIGGDGTMNAAVNGIQDFDNTLVGYIQTGSGNDLRKGLGIGRSRKKAVETLLRGKEVRRCDIGRITYHNRSSLIDPFTHKPMNGSDLPDFGIARENGGDPVRLFNISAGIGFDAAVCRQADASSLKDFLNFMRLGKMIYISEAVHMILTSPMPDLTITASDGTQKTYPKALFAVAMNTCYEGGGFKFCPNAVNTDGILDLCTSSGIGRLDFFRIFPTAYKGHHLKFDGVFSDRSSSWRIQSQVPLWVHSDGEVQCMSSDITIDLLPGKLRMMI